MHVLTEQRSNREESVASLLILIKN